jgi:hypothetical protein
LRIVSTGAAPGTQVQVSVVLEAQGDEHAVSFSLQFNPAVLTAPAAQPGGDLPAGTDFQQNSNQAAQGRYGVALVLPSDIGAGPKTLAAGARQVAVFTFNVAQTQATSTPLSFGDQPTPRDVIGAALDSLSLTYTGGTVSIGASALRLDSVSPRAGRASGGQQINLTGSFNGLATVKLGGETASWVFAPNSTTQIVVTTPAHAPGAVAIDLTPTAGPAVTKSNAFAYLRTVFTDDNLSAGVTVAKGLHILELRQAVDSLRAVAVLAPAVWTDPTLSPAPVTIKAAHVRELRARLEEAAAALGYPAAQYTDPDLAAGAAIKRIHVQELRQRIRNIAGS